MVALAVLLAAFTAVTVDVWFSGPLVGFDHLVDTWVRRHLPTGLINLSRHYLVLPGQRLYDVPPMAVLTVLLAWRRRQWRPLLVPLAVMVFLALVVPGLKLWTGRTNPRSGADLMFAGGTEYPSGHVINAIVVWGMALTLAAQLRWGVGRWLTLRRRLLLTTAVTLWVSAAVVVARTHWLTDVVASLFFGTALFGVVLRIGLVKAPVPLESSAEAPLAGVAADTAALDAPAVEGGGSAAPGSGPWSGSAG